jgi:N-acetylglucosaminyldiphosphoundecaprenol N-acetyl-beta-D-mannosaminyltransferase
VDGVGVDPLDVHGLLDRVGGLVRRGGATVAYVNVHVLNEAERDEALRAFLNAADLVYADGAGVVLGSRILGDRLPGRITGADWIWPFAERAAREGWRVAWIGGEPGVADEAAREIQERVPGLSVVFTSHGFVPESGQAAMIEACNAARPHVVFVGMGTPVQERWVAANRDRIGAPVVWCLGATADFVSGRVSRGPEWLHQRQEWLARLLVDPRRLWKRYLLGNPRFVLRVLKQRVTR